MTKTLTPSRAITEEVTSWPGVDAGPGRRGEFAFRVGRREIGHLHGDRSAHFSFPKALWARLREQGRIVPHPVFPDAQGPAARRIEGDDDVRDVIALLRLNYDRVRFGELRASAPEALTFAPWLHVRAFRLRRPRGDLLLYSVRGLEEEGVTRHYLNHWHEAMFPSEALDAPVFVHEADREATERTYAVRATFSRRHMLDDDFEVIPTPGHTPGATAYLWDSGRHRFLFTGDSVFLKDGEWVGAVLESSDRDAYVRSLELLRELDFDVLVPWAASASGPYVVETSRDDARERLGALAERIRGGADG